MTYFPEKMFKKGMHYMIYLQAYSRQDKRDNYQLRYYKKNNLCSFHTASCQLSMCYHHKFCKSFLLVHSQENNVYSFQWWLHIQYNQCKVHSWYHYHLKSRYLQDNRNTYQYHFSTLQLSKKRLWFGPVEKREARNNKYVS